MHETVKLLAGRAPNLRTALARAAKQDMAYVVVDGTLVPIDRLGPDRPYYSRKHKTHGMNVQVIASPDGTIVWVSGALPGSTNDTAADRIFTVVTRLAEAGLIALADKGYQGLGETVLTPYKGRDKPQSQKDANQAHARLRGPGERAHAQLQQWRVLRKLRCCPHKATRLVKAIHVLQDHEHTTQ